MSALLLAAVLGTAACGDSDAPASSASGRYTVGWREVAQLPSGRLVFTVRSVTAGEQGWSVEASMENRTRTAFIITRPHVRGGTRTGLVVRRAVLVANRFEPRLPRVFAPGDTWSGRFSGSRRVPRDSEVRVSFGPFFNGSSRPAYFRWVTDRSLRL